MNHDELAADLAAHLRGERTMVWTNMQLGPSGSPRPDVYTIDKSYVSPRPLAYEVKISLSDFRSDVTSGKWQSYLKYASGVYFACPHGLIGKPMVPDHCGLIVRHENVWRTVKKATLSPVKLPQDALLKLLIDGIAREGPSIRNAKYMSHGYSEKFARKYGQKAALWVAKAATIDREIESAEYSAKRIVEAAKERASQISANIESNLSAHWLELCSVLGVDSVTDQWKVRSAIQKLRDDKQGSPEYRALKQIRGDIARSLSRLDQIIETKEDDVEVVCKTE